MEQKLSLLDGCPLACGSRPAFQKQRHLQHHEQIRDRVGAQLFIVRSDFGNHAAPESHSIILASPNAKHTISNTENDSKNLDACQTQLIHFFGL